MIQRVVGGKSFRCSASKQAHIPTDKSQRFAENGGGTLADGFIALGLEGSLGSSYYDLTVSVPDEVAPGDPRRFAPGAAAAAAAGTGAAAGEARS